MSVMLKRQIGARIEKLDAQLASQDPDSVKSEIKQLSDAKKIASSKRMRNSLETEIGRLQQSLNDLDPKPIQDELALWKPVMDFVNSHPEYNKKRKAWKR